MRAEVIWGDARDVLATLPDACCDSVVTDPPYALTSGKNSTKGFMSARWDNGTVAHDPAFWAEVLRAAKPGAFLLAFGGTRTYHRLACAIEDSGWLLRDMIVHWIYASGFPKSQSCLKPSHEPILLARAPGPLQPLQIDACRIPTATNGEDPRGQGRPKGAEGCFPFSDDAWGNGHLRHTESHAGGRWPPNTVFSHHSDCRPTGVRRVKGAGWRDSDGAGGHKMSPGGVMGNRQSALPRPANGHHIDVDGYEQVEAWTCVEGCAIKALDDQAGPRTSGKGSGRSWGYAEGTHEGWKRPAHTHYPPKDKDAYYGDTGSASRFFPTFAPDPEDAVPFRYVPKAPARERCLADGTPTGHPTQKPVALAQWLAALVCVPGGTILDPFAGVASLGIGALRAGCHYLGIEQDAGYAAVAQRRLDEEQERRDGPLFAGSSAQEAVGAR